MTALPPGRAVHVAVGIIPATLTVLFAGLIALIALALDSGRRQYALDLADRFVDLASVLVGVTRPRRPEPLQAATPHRELPLAAQATLPFGKDLLPADPSQAPLRSRRSHRPRRDRPAASHDQQAAANHVVEKQTPARLRSARQRYE